MIGKLLACRVAPVVGMPVLLTTRSRAVAILVGKVIRTREPLGVVDIELLNGEVRYCVTNDPYAEGLHWEYSPL